MVRSFLADLPASFLADLPASFLAGVSATLIKGRREYAGSLTETHSPVNRPSDQDGRPERVRHPSGG